jgi:E4 protein.
LLNYLHTRSRTIPRLIARREEKNNKLREEEEEEESRRRRKAKRKEEEEEEEQSRTINFTDTFVSLKQKTSTGDSKNRNKTRLP